TLAHELAHAILLETHWLTAEVPDREQLAGLATVPLGLGVFAANYTVREVPLGGIRRDLRLSRHGSLPCRTLGYALALFAARRGGASPGRADWLRPDASRPFHAGARFLARSEDSLCHPATIKRDEPSPARPWCRSVSARGPRPSGWRRSGASSST